MNGVEAYVLCVRCTEPVPVLPELTLTMIALGVLCAECHFLLMNPEEEP